MKSDDEVGVVHVERVGILIWLWPTRWVLDISFALKDKSVAFGSDLEPRFRWR